MDSNQLECAKAFCLISGYVSTSSLQRHVLIGYNEAKQLVDLLKSQNFCEHCYTENYGYKVITMRNIE